jgi:hypothetical protein
MKFNFNSIVNEKYALKAFSRGTKDNNLLADLNNKLLLGLNLPTSQTFPRVHVNKKSVSKIDNSLTWKLVSSQKENGNQIPAYIEKPLIDINPSNSIFYRRSFIRRKRAFLICQESLKGGVRPLSVRSRFLTFKKSYLKNSSISSKLYYLFLHKNNNVLFQKPKLSCVSSRIYTIFDRKTKQVTTQFNSQYMALSESQIYSAITTKFKNSQKKVSEDKIYRFISKNLENRKELSIQNSQKHSSLSTEVFNQLISNLKTKSLKKFTNKELSTFSDVNSPLKKTFFEKYINLNEKNKETIKKTIEATNIEFIKSDLFKIRAEQFSKYSTNLRFSKSKRFKKYHKGKSKDFSRINTKSFFDIFKRLQKSSGSKFVRNSAEKFKFDRKTENKFKLSVKNKKSKI